MSNATLTNVLLVIIATLLLVLVIQNGLYHPSFSERPAISSTSSPYPQPMMAQNMFFAALKAFPEGCGGMKILAECSSPEAEAVKEKISSWAMSGKPPREVFDLVVSTWGEQVLTDEAQQIRKHRRSK